MQERLPRFRRQYKIQEVIKRRQVMLVQVVKEERGTKGAALTTYLSLAGRYSVLMPNTARGGGISRKITSSEDRTRLKEIAQELEVPEGMGVILRTAGASRTKTEVKRDFEYLLRLWETVRDLTLKSTAPKLVYEEGSLTKRSIRDLYGKDIEEIIVSGEEGFKEAREFMRMLMPSHAKHVKHYKDTQPLFTRYGIESQLDAMFSPVVQLRSGGYIVINQAEALVAIDVNSGRATREHHIEDTALKTNCEAAEEIARQLRLRDLAGLIVIDFIDMDEGRNNRTVERRLKEALKHDRARIQVGRISHFGLLEMSRQRIRTSVLESSTEKCPVCGGSGHVRSVSSVVAAIAARHRGNADQGRNAQSDRAHARRSRALCAQSQARPSARAGGALPHHHHGVGRPGGDRPAVLCDRPRRTGAHAGSRAQSCRPAAADSTSPVEEIEDEIVEADEHDGGTRTRVQPKQRRAKLEPRVEGGEREGGRRKRRRRRGRGGRGRGGEPRDECAQQFTHDTVPSTRSPTRIMTRARPKRTDSANHSRARKAAHLARAKLAKDGAGVGAAAAAAAATGSAMVKRRSAPAKTAPEPRIAACGRGLGSADRVTKAAPAYCAARSKSALLHRRLNSPHPAPAHRSRRAGARPFASRLLSPPRARRHHLQPRRRRRPVISSTGCRRTGSTQARLVGQAPARRQGLAAR